MIERGAIDGEVHISSKFLAETRQTLSEFLLDVVLFNEWRAALDASIVHVVTVDDGLATEVHTYFSFQRNFALVSAHPTPSNEQKCDNIFLTGN